MRERLHRSGTLTLVALLAGLLAACSDDAAPANQLDADAGNTDMPSDGDAGALDADDSSDGPDLGEVCPPAAGSYGASCASDDECASGLCIDAGASGRVCTQQCLTTCQPFCDGRPTFCRSVPLDDGQIAFVCRPEREDLCAPCQVDVQCAAGRCLDFGDGETACGRDCTAENDCPDGYGCGDGDPDHAGQCVPQSGTCTCNEALEGVIRPCSLTNAVGTCAGRQFCDATDGWSTCDADTPALELCNGVDDDCDGVRDNGVVVGAECPVFDALGERSCPGIRICQGATGEACLGTAPALDVCDGFDNDCDDVIDQDYVDDEGRYVDFEHCGACGNDCTERFAFAADIACDTERDEPACVVVSCLGGYQRVGDTQCVPLQSNACQPCVEDTECNLDSPGAACVTLVDASDPANVSRVCGRDCADDGAFGTDCDDGFVCSTFDRGGGEVVSQCVPSAGTCACVDNPSGFSVPCRVTINDGELSVDSDERGVVTCPGSKTCEGDEFGACMLPADACDGFDNDCSGRIDDSFRDDQGRYVQDEHCGRCNNDCTARFEPAVDNANGTCALVDTQPICQMECLDGYVDLFNGTDDGCECQVLAAVDLPDDDPEACLGARCDANCDGVDGQVALALFVSKTGRPGAAGTRVDPLDTIQAALGLAAAPGSGIRDIYVATGVYSENLVLADGVSLYGGYSLDFVTRDAQRNPTTLFGVRPQSAAGQIGTVTARDLVTPTTLSGFSIYGFDADPLGAGVVAPGRSSYTVYLADCTNAFRFVNNRVVAGNGGSGAQGPSGPSGLSGNAGLDGGLGRAGTSSACGVSATPGGTGGASSCGGGGGNGGDALCPRASTSTSSYVACNSANAAACLNQCPNTGGLTQDPGDLGGNNGGCAGSSCGQAGAPGYDFWTDGGSCGLCGLQLCLPHIGGAGSNGRSGSDASPGPGCSDNSGSVDLATGLWRGNGGGNGVTNASPGGGGGGGGAGAGFDVLPAASGCNDNLGGSGGGGGGGGCAGQPGNAGTGGGASFAVFVYFSATAPSAPQLVDNDIRRGLGGAGGNGGPGGAGGRGGKGAEGGFTFPAQSFCTSPGGAGGNGGEGGAGAGGGGGCGGNAYGIFLFDGPNAFGGAATLWQTDNAFPASGQGGPGGTGGASINAGSRGGDGVPGQVLPVVVE